MPWNVSWHDPGEGIVVFEPANPWTWAEYEEAAYQAQAMIGNKDYIVDTIYNLGNYFKMPNANALPHLQRVYASDPKNSGMIVAIGANRFVQALVKIIGSVMGGEARFRYVASMEEALVEIHQAQAERVAGERIATVETP